jgi:hypothetical protein
MQNELKIFTDGVIKNGDREFTRLIGGFGENKPIITVKQIAELMGYDNSIVTRTINRNIEHFTKDIDIIDLKSAMPEWQSEIGYTKNAYNASKNIYALSEAGFLLYLKFAEGDKAVELYKNFIEDYFKTKAENIVMKRTLEEEIEFIKGEKAMLIGTMIMEQDEQKRIEYTMQLERLNNRLSELKSSLDNKTIKKALDSQSKLKESKKEYVNQTDFGARFNNKIGSKTVGKLLKIVGLAKKSYRKTTPYEQYIPKYAINDIDNEEVRRFDVSYKWAYEPCVEFIDKWLTKHNRYEEFYSITDKTKLTAYINSLYNIYVEKVAQ